MVDARGLGIRPLNARSLVLSVLLGLRRPALSARALVDVAETFGVAAGTMRTAVSRMVAAGELTADGGEYHLAGPLLERKAAQDIGRRPAAADWDGAWWVALVTAPRRDIADRRAFRSHMANLRMGELRPETWLRPANLDGPVGDDGLAVVRGPLASEDPAELAGRLWPLAAITEHADLLLELVEAALPAVESGSGAALPDTIGLSAAVVRFLRAEPLLPPSLTPQPWRPDELRARYRTFDAAFLRLLTARVVATP